MKNPDIKRHKYRDNPQVVATCFWCDANRGTRCDSGCYHSDSRHLLRAPAKLFIMGRGESAYTLHGYFHSPDNNTPAYVKKEEGLTIKMYFKYGILHREDDLPAKEADDCNEWYVDGKLHRVGGPAIDYFAENTSGFYLRGRRYLKVKTYCKIAKLSAHDELMMTLKYGDKLPDFKW